MSLDPVALTQDLIRRPSVTPADEGAMDIVERTLAELGFVCRRMKFGEIENLYARYGAARPNLCFAGHTDVVPTGPLERWASDPFVPSHRNGRLYGRGAVDMKTAVACMTVAPDISRWSSRALPSRAVSVDTSSRFPPVTSGSLVMSSSSATSRCA